MAASDSMIGIFLIDGSLVNLRSIISEEIYQLFSVMHACSVSSRNAHVLLGIGMYETVCCDICIEALIDLTTAVAKWQFVTIPMG
jgi:hypothetical protein